LCDRIGLGFDSESRGNQNRRNNYDRGVSHFST
jgi:hypothetical protein